MKDHVVTIEQQPGEPRCPSCHEGSESDCSDEHLAWMIADGERYLAEGRSRSLKAMALCPSDSPCVPRHSEHSLGCGWLQTGGENDLEIHWAPCDCGVPGLHGRVETLKNGLLYIRDRLLRKSDNGSIPALSISERIDMFEFIDEILGTPVPEEEEDEALPP